MLLALDQALDVVGDYGGQPAGTLRVNADEAAARVLLRSIVPTFHERFPFVALDLVTDGRFVDIVEEGFDAGVRLGEAVPKDMVAVRFVAVASPAYLERHGTPRAPEDLATHACIRVRLPSGKPYRWEFARNGREIAVDVPGPLTLDHPGLMAEAAAAGLGIAYLAERWAVPLIAYGALVPVLDEWCPMIPGLFLYYPGHRHVPAALRAFIDVLKAGA